MLHLAEVQKSLKIKLLNDVFDQTFLKELTQYLISYTASDDLEILLSAENIESELFKNFILPLKKQFPKLKIKVKSILPEQTLDPDFIDCLV